jgi:hypothetical protein
VLASDTQFALVVADHPQSRVVVMASDPEPPASVKLVEGLLTCSWHFSELGAVIPVEVCVDVHAAIPAAAERAKTMAMQQRIGSYPR